MLRYAITDRTLLASSRNAPDDRPHQNRASPSSAPEQQALVARCAALAREGIDFLLIREKDLHAGTLTSLCRHIASTVRAANPLTRILVSGRADVALAAGLDGVNLTCHPSELTPLQVRTLFPAAYITLSCHTLAEVHSAHTAQPDAILYAPVFGKTISGHQVAPAIGLPALSEACRAAAPIPVLALGGITAKNAPSCIAAGAAGIAAIRLFMAPDPPRNSRIPQK